ncbi:insulinase family protein [Flavobacterium aquidurense]|uniref:M16 family metallopeptidase n=1 Tax=Flavobacterium aquidurense TaxID=362413 RepID=UPI0028600DFE|nr:insulinase family protein [Flavobacterium aquidurense]MDR7370234.1 zinc protease [Flavobacterium aquidurense]
MKRIFILSLIFFISINSEILSQNINYNDALPVDKTIKKGVLPNGMTYYIKSTDVVKGAASYYIIQNVGSILENEDQRGLAHFLEHMAFNGTENFPGKEILNTLQKHGAVFGKDINAYTSFDETVYNLNNIPLKDGLLDTCLTVLKDWSNSLLLTNEEIDAERGVIKEEWRTSQNGYSRLFVKSMPVLFNGSKYAERLPIGLMSVVEHFDYKTLRDFYHDWYRTDLQAIAVIGDVNLDEIEQKIIEKFSKIPAIKKTKERFIIDIPANKEMAFIYGTDPEVSTASINFSVRDKKSLEPETVSDLKRDLLESIVSIMLSGRISEKSQKPDASFLNAQLWYGGFSRTSNAFTITIYPKLNQQQQALKEVLTEIQRAVKFGFIQTEVDRSIASIKSSYENKIAKKNDQDHGQIEAVIQNNFLSNRTMKDTEKEYEIAKQLLQQITAEELHNTIKRFYGQENRYLNVTGVEGQDNLTEVQAKEIISSVQNDTSIVPYNETLEGATITDGVNIKAGTIKKTILNKETGATVYQLSNGVKVHYKFVDKEKDNVSLNAISYGGKSLLSNADLPSANLLGDLISMSGLGNYSASDLQKIMAGKTAGVSIGLGDITESLSGYSNTKDVETMLQLAHVYFVKPRFDGQSFSVLESNIDNYIIRRSKDIGEKMRDSLTVALYGKNNPKKQLFNQDYARAISFEKIKKIYNERFADASDFDFFIVGDVNETQLKPLLEQYIASLPTKKIKEVYKNNEAEWLSKTLHKDIYIPMQEPKVSVNIAYKKEMPYSIKNSIYTDALGDILQLRVLETVREAEGGAYSPRAGAFLSREPKKQIYAGFSFDCNPDLTENLVRIVNDELQKIANGIINDDDLNKTKTNFIKEREQAKDKNGYEMNLLTSYFRYNENINDPKNFEDIVNKMSKKDIQNIGKQLLDGGESYQVIFKPKQ